MDARSSRMIVGLGLAALVLGWAAPVRAEENGGSYVDGALRKLGRGIANVATCPAELIRTSELTGRKDGALAGLTVGLVKGVWRTVVRGATGVFEVVTFYAEIPKDFAPLMKPEFVWANGNWSE